MFHAVSQMPADDDELASPGIGSQVLPMFSESRFSNSIDSNTSRGSAGAPTSREGSATVTPSEGGLPRARRGRRELRSRRRSVEMTAMSQSFAGPDADGGTDDPGTFRWDATVGEDNGEGGVAEESSGDQGGGDDEMDVKPRGSIPIGPLRRKRVKLRFRPPPRDLENMSSAARPWYIVVPDSRTHQLLDHLGEE